MLVLAGETLATDVLANLTEADYELLVKYDDASEGSGVVNAMWIDSLQRGSAPAQLVVNYVVEGGDRSLVVEGDYTQRSGSTLELLLGGVGAAGSAYDRLEVDGEVSLLGGDLVVGLEEGFTPAAGDSFEVLGFGALVGEFDSVVTPDLPFGLAWDTSELLSSGVLAVEQVLPGDYNDDGVVDAADYVVWRGPRGRPGRNAPQRRRRGRRRYRFGAVPGLGRELRPHPGRPAIGSHIDGSRAVGSPDDQRRLVVGGTPRQPPVTR